MPTPSIQTLRTDAQQVLNLDSISAVRSVVAASLANANAGTPLNPNLTTQQLWNEFYQIVTQPKSDIESIIANQLMKFLYAPPAPGGAGADKQVIFNDGGVLAGDPGLTYDKVTNALTITGAANFNGGALAGYLNGSLMFGSSGNVLNLFAQSSGFHIKNNSGTFPLLTLNNSGDFTVQDGAGSGRLILNSTGLGVGASPVANFRLTSIGGFASGNGGAYIETGEFNRYGLVVNNSNALASTNLIEIRKASVALAAFTSAGNLAFDNGLGIDFSATTSGSGTMTSELLNDYEEGTFIATLKGSTTDPTTPVTVTARYTKIGRVVNVIIYFGNVNTTGASGSVQVIGLPFTSASGSFFAGSTASGDTATFTGTLGAWIAPASTQVDLLASPSGGSITGATHNAGAGRYLALNITYTV